MHNPTTADGMSASELVKCRETLKRRWENRRIDEALLRRAWETAHQVAAVLYQDFGAERVAVFGSLAERDWFTKVSDIDIAVWGLSDAESRDARWEISDLCHEFKIDLVNFEESTEFFRERVLRQAIPLKDGGAGGTYLHHLPTIPDQKGAIYEMSQIKIIQRIANERAKIARVIESITELLEEIEVATPRHKKFFEELTAKKLVEVYNGIERIFERIADKVDMQTPKGHRWHNDLLEQMAERRPGRPHVISQETLLRLKELLDFRHKVSNIYGDELIYEKAEEHAKLIGELFATVSEELDTFAAFLTETDRGGER